MKITMFNSGIKPPEDEGILLKDIFQDNVADKYYLSEKLLAGFDAKKERRKDLKIGFDSLNIRSESGKASTLTARYFKTSMSDPYILQRPRGFNKGGDKALDGNCPTLSSCSWEQNNYAVLAGQVRKLTPRECMRLQTIPEHYIDKLLTSGISNTQLYKMTGNAWTMKVISHIIKSLK